MSLSLRNILVGVLAFILFFASFEAVFAAVEITITSFPSSTTAGQEFEVTFSASGVTPTGNYYVKALGGVNFTEIDTKNDDSWFQQNSAWSNMPTFIPNSEGSSSGTLKARFDIGTQSGSKQFKVRIRKSDEDSNYDSLLAYIDVIAVPPSPTPSPKQSVAPAPVASPTHTPAPVATKLPTPISTKIPTEKVAPSQNPDILGESATNLTPSPTTQAVQNLENKSQRKFPTLAIVLILLGLGFIGTSCYLAFGKRNKAPEGESLI